MSAPEIEPLGETAWLVRWGSVVDAAVNQRVHVLMGRLRAQAPPWLEDVVPAYASLAVILRQTDAHTRSRAQAWLAAHVDSEDDRPTDGSSRTVEVPVSYGGEHGPDLESAAAALGLSPDALVHRHAGGRYRVGMIGFAPGFPYLLGLDPDLALARHDRPRQRVAAGSVGIGGAQTGIYPGQGAGGWQLLGRTPLRLFDACRTPPAVLQPGDHVRLAPIDSATFKRRLREPGGLDAD